MADRTQIGQHFPCRQSCLPGPPVLLSQAALPQSPGEGRERLAQPSTIPPTVLNPAFPLVILNSVIKDNQTEIRL